MSFSKTNILVIGGGLMGLLTARELSQAGERVTLIEQGAVGRESSWAGGGILSPLYPWRYPDPVSALARWSQGHYPTVCRELAGNGIDPEWTRSGLLMVAVDEPERALATGWASEYGYRLEALDRHGMKACESALGEEGSGLWMPEIAQLRNPRLLQSVRRDLKRRGCQSAKADRLGRYCVRLNELCSYCR